MINSLVCNLDTFVFKTCSLIISLMTMYKIVIYFNFIYFFYKINLFVFLYFFEKKHKNGNIPFSYHLRHINFIVKNMCFFFEIIKGKFFGKWTFINVQFYNMQPFIEFFFEKEDFFTFISISIIKNYKMA